MSQADIQKALEELRKGGVIGLPTETVYGLAGSIFNHSALERIFKVKERPFFDPLIVHIADLEQLDRIVAEWPAVARELAAAFWPGPLTLVLPKHPDLDSLITSGLETVAVRMPKHPLALEVIRSLGEPVAAPSANKFGKTSPTTAEHVRASFPGLLVLDGGPAEVGIESTVLQVGADALTILRPGAVTAEMLSRFGLPVRRAVSQASPGHTEHHYQPDVPLYLVGEEGKAGGAEVLLSDDARVAARELYARMRAAAATKPKFLFIRRRASQKSELWDAVWDRVERAASK